MGLPKGRYGLSAAIGGHGMNMAADVHENEVLNTAGCVSCHKDIKTADSKRAWSKAGGAGVTWVPSSKIYAITAEADYDQDGTKEYMQDEVQGLMDRLVNQQGTGAMQKNVPSTPKALTSVIRPPQAPPTPATRWAHCTTTASCWKTAAAAFTTPRTPFNS